MKNFRCVPALAVLAAAPLLADNLTIVSKVTKDSGPPRTATSYLSSDHIRFAQPDGHDVIVDMKAGQMTVLDGTKKTYFVMTREDLKALAARMKELANSPEMKKAREQMESLPPEQRAKMKQMMGGMFSFEVKDLGTHRRIAGYPCEEWSVAMGSMSHGKECLTTELQFPVQAWDLYREFADAMKEMAAAFGPMAEGIEKMQDEFKRMRGFPLATTSTVDVMGQHSVTTSEVTEVSHAPIPSSAWEIPAGYTKVDNPMLKAFDRHGRK
jgi:hypothetical protein